MKNELDLTQPRPEGGELKLYIPRVEDMWFRKKMLEDPDTMAYNAGWAVSYGGYHPDTGCIDFPESEWKEARSRLVGHEPDRFYAFVQEVRTGEFVGEVNYQYVPENGWYDMGVVICAPHRGRGYGLPALELLLRRAFVVDGLPRLHNSFEPERAPGLAIHQKAGFRQVGTGEMVRFGRPTPLLELELTREEYLEKNPRIGQSQAKIVSWSTAGEEVCASAARISTTQGDAAALFRQAQGNPRNRDLIGKVLSSGHRSVAEHAVFSIALENVSVYVEQFFIECRLASFTVKSRRYVDFSGLGYYVPPELEGEALAAYQKYMDGLFAAYQALLDDGVPKEDARFLLPYSLCSNFYCTLNARELARVLQAMRTGRGRGVPELQELARQLEEQLRERFPWVLPEPRPDGDEALAALPPLVGDEPEFVGEAEAGGVRLLAGPADPMALLEAAHRAENPRGAEPFSLEALAASDRPRALEQLNYAFAISGVTLSGITHLVRHRMQSILVPPIQGLQHTRYILPDTIRDNAPAREKYQAALAEAARQAKAMAADPVLSKYNYYFAVSGNVMDVMTTMNARELELFLRLRTCSRAQWEVREIAVDMLRLLRQSFPELFDRFGPSCYLTGKCPEGRMTCGRSEAVKARFAGEL